MKRNCINKFALLAGFVLTMILGCRKNDTVFDQSADKRTSTFLNNAAAILTGAPNGWAGTVETGTGAFFNYYMKFDNNNRVIMYSDFDTTTAATAKESGYRLKALQQPSLLFDTYGYIHLPADPSSSVNGGEAGKGLQSDFEFSMDTVTSEYILLTGRFNRSKARLVKATKEQEDSWKNKEWLSNIQSLMSLSKIPTYFTRLNINGQQICDVKTDNRSRQINFVTYTSTGGLNDNLANYRYVSGGIQLDTPVVVNGQTISGLKNMVWDPNTSTVNLLVNNNPAFIASATQPVVIDADGYRHWRELALNNRTLWASAYGFVREWHYDVFGNFNTLRFYVLGYIPSANPSTDRLITAYLTPNQDAIEGIYGYFMSGAAKPGGYTAFTDQTAFREANNLQPVTAGNAPDTNAEQAMKNATEAMADPEGYYFLQTSTTSFDMVSVKDARTWTNWVLY